MKNKYFILSLIFTVVWLILILVIWHGYILDRQEQIRTPSVKTDQAVTSNFLPYENQYYYFQYPRGYVLKKNFGVGNENDPLRILSVENSRGRMEIFRMADFGDRPFGFEEGEPSPADIGTYVPSEFLKVEQNGKTYDVWLYYPAGDEQTKDELQAIYQSIVLK